MKKFFSILTVCTVLMSLCSGACAEIQVVNPTVDNSSSSIVLVEPEAAAASTQSFSDSSVISLSPETSTASAETAQSTQTITIQENTSTMQASPVSLQGVEYSDVSITADVSELDLKVGEKYEPTWTVTPDNEDVLVEFSSSDTSVAKVNNNEKIVAKGVGTATITAKATYNDKSATATIKVTVTDSTVTKITVTPSFLELDVDETQTLTATVTPSQAYKWSSKNPEIATVSDSGVVKAIAKGNTEIVLTASDGTTESVPVSVTVPVTPEKPYMVSVSPNNSSYGSVYLSGGVSSAQYAKGATVTVTASPNAGYEIQSWTANGSVISAAGKRSSFSFKADNSYVIVANFAPITSEYTITYSSGAYATAQYVTWSNTFMAGTNAYIDSTQYSRTGYYQDGWTTVDGSSVNSYPYGTVIANISSNYTLYPHWTANAAASYTLTITYNAQYGSVYYGNSYIANGSTVTIAQGQSKTFSFYPSDGYYVWNLNFAGYNIGSCSSYTVSYDSMRGASRTMNVTFASIYSSPKTGDNSNIALWGALAGCAVVGIGVLFVVNKKSSKKSGKDK